MASQKLSLFSNKFTDHFVIERQGVADIAPIETFTDRQDASFEWTGPNLALGPGGAPASGFGESGQLRRAGDPTG